MASKKKSAPKKHVAADARELRPIESRMLEKGYASSRMVAQKVEMSFVSILRMAREGEFKTVRHGQQVWIEIESVRTKFAEAEDAGLLDLHDWSFPGGLTG